MGLVVLAGGAVVAAVAVGEVQGLEELAVYEAFEPCAEGGDGLDVDLKLAACMAVGAIVGAWFIGAPLADKMPGPMLKQSFGYFAMCIGFYYTGLPAALWHRLHQ